MKTRQAFVANSSSSSFIVLTSKDATVSDLIKPDSIKLAQSIINNYDLDLAEFGYSSIEEAVYKEADLLLKYKKSQFKDINVDTFYFCSEDFDDDVLYKLFCYHGVYNYKSENILITSVYC